MPAPVKYLDFVEQLGLEQHSLELDVIKIALTDVAPVNTHTVFDPITNHDEPTNVNGYTANGEDILATWSESAGTATLNGVDVTYTATAGGIGPFRYIIMYNSSNTTDMLIFSYDHGTSITLADGESFVFDILTNIFTLV